MKLTKQEDSCLQVLRQHEDIYQLYKKTGEVVNLYPHIRKTIADCYRIHDPYFHYNDACNACIIEMLNIVYEWYYKQIKK